MSPAAAPEHSTATHGTAWQLPVELLLQCLRAADLVTRIRASHVCRTWREAALADCRLWDKFACPEFLSRRHEEAMFSLLEAMLLRSRALPFHLAIPHAYYPTKYEYRDRLLRVEGFDVSRLAAYCGPGGLFELLNPTQIPLPSLVFLDVLEIRDGEPDTRSIFMDAQLSARCLPNLRELVVPSVRFSADCDPFTALKSITFAKIYTVFHQTLFARFPWIVRMVITDSAMGTPLPDPPVPPSFEELSIRCRRPRSLDLVAVLGHWRRVRVRRVVAREVYSMQDVLPLFLASHECPIELRLLGDDDQTVVLSTIPDNESVWTISPSLDWADDFLEDIENPASERLTSISISFSRLGALLAAQLEAPGLENLELRVDSAADADSPLLRASDGHSLRAPRLRSMSFALGDDCPDSLEDALSVLRMSFRALLVYNAELLDAITVSFRAEHACAGFAPFAKEYVLSPR